MPDPIDISSLAQGPQPPQEPLQEPQPVVEPPPPPPAEPYTLKYRGEERQVPREIVDSFAPYLGTKPEGVVNMLQRAQEANRIWNENLRLQQERDALMQELEASRQNRMGGFQPPQPAPQQQPQFQYPMPQPQYQQAQDDPIALIQGLARMQQMTHGEIQELKTTLRQEQETMRQQAEEMANAQLAQEIESTADRFLSEHNKNRRDPISKEEFLQEVALSGGSNRYVPIERAMDRAWRVITYDERGTDAQQELKTRLRAPNAQVVIPAPTAAPAPAVDKRTELEKQLAGLTVGQAIDYLPDARR